MRGIVSFDFMFGMLATLLIIAMMVQVCGTLMDGNGRALSAQETENRLMMVSDRVVGGHAEGMDGYRVVNLVGSVSVPEKSGLENICVGFEEPVSGREAGTCIYRLVLHDGEIKKMYFCGSAGSEGGRGGGG
ncbi:MAG: hypothetical protein ACP5NX_03385 [Candidatus Bilamarchaeaceae archaeon]